MRQEIHYQRCTTKQRTRKKRVVNERNPQAPDLLVDEPFGWQATFEANQGRIKVTVTWPLDAKPADLEKWRATGVTLVITPKLAQTKLEEC